MNSKFKPTLALEMDLMKSLLQDIKKLNRTLPEKIVEEFWLNQQNKALYLILKEELQKKQDGNAFPFYVNVLNIAEKTIPDFDETVYEDLFEVNFNFSNVFLDYYHYFKCKKIARIFRNITQHFEEKNIVNEAILVELAKAKKEMNTIGTREMILRKL